MQPVDKEKGIYRIARTRSDKEIALDLNWEGAVWGWVDSLAIDRFLPESSDHRPQTRLKMQYSREGIFGLFQVKDRYVRCVHTSFQDLVCKDSCVEVYFQPQPTVIPDGQPHAGYINLEMSGNGTLLSYHIRDAERAPGGFRDFDKLTTEDAERILIDSTLPDRVDPEIQDALEWRLAFFLPFDLMEKYLGCFRDPELGVKGQCWGGDAFKCADDSSHPHWASWQPCSEFNFHAPAEFGRFLFE